MKFVTNGQAFDFPLWREWPKQCFVIASSPRCGSNLLQRILWQTGHAGAPEEYFTETFVADFRERWHLVNKEGVLNMQRYRDLLMQWRTSPNGVFGVKVHGGHLQNSLLRNIDIAAFLRKPRYVWLQRSDKEAQAISYSLAKQTGVWIVDREWLPMEAGGTRTPRYDAKEIKLCMQEILRQEHSWEEYFDRQRAEMLKVVYEDLACDPAKQAKRVLEYLDVDCSELNIPEPNIAKQASRVNEEWLQKWREQKPVG